MFFLGNSWLESVNISSFSLLAAALQVLWLVDPDPFTSEVPGTEKKTAVVQKEKIESQPDKELEAKEDFKPAHTVIEGSGTYYGGLEEETNWNGTFFLKRVLFMV